MLAPESDLTYRRTSLDTSPVFPARPSVPVPVFPSPHLRDVPVSHGEVCSAPLLEAHIVGSVITLLCLIQKRTHSWGVRCAGGCMMPSPARQ